ncbi:MAG: hypothetical protein JWM89_1527 [Acidimicrobiales bacterium]|nr:hypothetical protein [Acidimicrobiales bacterium]
MDPLQLAGSLVGLFFATFGPMALAKVGARWFMKAAF